LLSLYPRFILAVTRKLGLEQEQLYENRDLNLTTDFRDVLGELVSVHMGNRNLSAVFPGYQGSAQNFRGFIGV